MPAVGYVPADPDLTFLADHAIVIALPFVLPVLLVVVMVAVVAYRDRHRPDDDEQSSDGEQLTDSKSGEQAPADTDAGAFHEGKQR